MEPAYTRAELWERFLERNLATSVLVNQHLRINPLDAPLLDVRLQLRPDGTIKATADQTQLHEYISHCVVKALPQVVEAFLEAAYEEELEARAA